MCTFQFLIGCNWELWNEGCEGKSRMCDGVDRIRGLEEVNKSLRNHINVLLVSIPLVQIAHRL